MLVDNIFSRLASNLLKGLGKSDLEIFPDQSDRTTFMPGAALTSEMSQAASNEVSDGAKPKRFRNARASGAPLQAVHSGVLPLHRDVTGVADGRQRPEAVLPGKAKLGIDPRSQSVPGSR